MKNTKNQTLGIVITIVLTFSMIASTILIPNAEAHTPPYQIPTYSYALATPNPVGIGQTAEIAMWVDKVAPTTTGLFGDVLTNYSLTVTTPGGTTTTILANGTAGEAAELSASYVPTAVGNYTFVFKFGGTTIQGANPPPSYFAAGAGAYIGDYFEPSQSAPVILTVQQTPISGYPSNPLPTSYWTRPIEASGNLGWYAISGNWYGFASVQATTGAYSNLENFNPYTTPPTTAHILWTKPEAFGGVVGGELGGTESGSSYFAQSHNEPKLAQIIVNGILYYEDYPGPGTTPAGWCAVNLQTGQTLWTMSTSQVNSALLKNGEVFNYLSVNEYGGYAYLWGTQGTTYSMYDAMTGNFVLNITSVTLGTLTEDQNGNLLDYYVNSSTANAYNAPTLNLWNATDCVMNWVRATNTGIAGNPSVLGNTWYPPQNANIPFSYGIQWSKPLATNITGGGSFSTLGISKVDTGATDSISTPTVLMTSTNPNSFSSWNSGWQIQAGYNAYTGQQLWLVNRTLPTWCDTAILCSQDGMYAIFCFETGAWYVYSMTTGQQLWGPITSPAFQAFDSESVENGIIADGKLIGIGFGGDVTAFNATNGNVLWTWSTPNSGTESPYGTYPLWVGFNYQATVAGDELLIGGGHEYSPPLFQGSQLWAINITTGKTVWNDLGFDCESCAAVSDGVAVDFNSYDCQIYAYGQGPSRTTINAPDIGVTTSTPITITGSVTDISAGSQQNAVAANFPNGLPCVSDASMTSWMEHVYQQQPMPSNVTGVPVTFYVLDSNNNYRSIGTTTTSALGGYSFTWTPDIQGNYTVYATFAGTGAYYGSTASTGFYANSPAPTAAPTTTPLTGLASNTTVEYGITAIAIIIIVIGAVLALLVTRKHP